MIILTTDTVYPIVLIIRGGINVLFLQRCVTFFLSISVITVLEQNTIASTFNLDLECGYL